MPTTVVTGGASGIGRATALEAARQGHDIVVADLAPSAKQVVEEITEIGTRALAVTTDVTVEAQVVELFDRAESELAPVTGLVNAAGLLYSAECTELRWEPLAQMLAVNVTGLMLCSREAGRRMMRSHGGPGGSIVNISSMAATIGGRRRGAAYAASKAAVDAFTTGMAKELGPEGVRVNAVRPGIVETAMSRGISDAAAWRAAVEESIPMGRMGQPQEVADAVLWLMSDRASWVSGAHVNISGGGFLVSGSF